MARSFPGGAAGDRIIVTRYTEVDNLTTLSIGAWVYRSGVGGSGNGIVVTKSFGTSLYESSPNLYNVSAAKWTTTTGVWQFGASSLNTWHHVLVTYAYTSTGTVPLVYLDGVLVGLTTIGTPAGTATVNDSAQDIRIGNSSPANYCWFGRLANVAIWNRILTADEARYLWSVAPNTPQSGGALATGLVLSLALDGTASPEPNTAKSANPGVVTGTSNAAGPTLFVPGGGSGSPKLYLGSTAVYPA